MSPLISKKCKITMRDRALLNPSFNNKLNSLTQKKKENRRDIKLKVKKGGWIRSGRV